MEGLEQQEGVLQEVKKKGEGSIENERTGAEEKQEKKGGG